MEGLSKKEIEITAWLEFYKKYFFTISDIQHFFKNTTQRYNSIKNLMKKKRIVKLNRTKYYLIPHKAKSGGWTENYFILADEIFNGDNYCIGDWAAANYWKLTDQIPMKISVYTTKRQGVKTILNTRFIFHRTTKHKISKAVTEKIGEHTFKMMGKEDMTRWIKQRN